MIIQTAEANFAMEVNAQNPHAATELKIMENQILTAEARARQNARMKSDAIKIATAVLFIAAA